MYNFLFFVMIQAFCHQLISALQSCEKGSASADEKKTQKSNTYDDLLDLVFDAIVSLYTCAPPAVSASIYASSIRTKCLL